MELQFSGNNDHILSVFHECDEGKKGYLTRDDLKVAVVMLFGYKPSKYEVDQIMKGIGGPGVSLEHFVSLMTTKLAAVVGDDEIRQIFMAFDTTCRGFLTLVDVQKAFSTVAPHIPSHRVQKVFSEIDRDGDGRVSYRDFEYMMKYSTEDAL
ncbi:EF-hand calcium-binding domain-containing protein 11-like [Amphiura filiformis]|uniref:EF-hand calcium-binding domain-containing protein 11-like n=1 Tax=Amphiura filiformis TaxID=82378 RepID=UPI003B216638